MPTDATKLSPAFPGIDRGSLYADLGGRHAPHRLVNCRHRIVAWGAIGSQAMSWVDLRAGSPPAFAALGMAFRVFIAGLESDLPSIEGPTPLRDSRVLEAIQAVSVLRANHRFARKRR